MRSDTVIKKNSNPKNNKTGGDQITMTNPEAMTHSDNELDTPSSAVSVVSHFVDKTRVNSTKYIYVYLNQSREGASEDK